VTRTLSLLSSVKRGKVSSNSAIVKANMFVGLYISRISQYIINVWCNEATTIGALNKKTFHSPPFPSGILHLPLVALPGLA
jgi:hypothetical protein